MQNKLLEILIPTFNRPRRAKAAIESVISIKDDRITVSCNSNGPSPLLRSFCEKSGNVNYSEFEENRGFHQNMQFLLEKSNSKFAMFMADEDMVDSKNIKNLLDWLDVAPCDVGCGVCQVESKAPNIDAEKLRSEEESIDAKVGGFSLLSRHETGYLSGWFYKLDRIRVVDRFEAFEKPSVNMYPHLELALAVARRNQFCVVRTPVIQKGEHAFQGGLTFDKAKSRQNPQVMALNSEVYGYAARVAQFHYRFERIKRHRPFYNGDYLRRQVKLILWFSMAATSGRRDCGQQKKSIKGLYREGISVAERNGCSSHFISLFVFSKLSKLPPPIVRLSLKVFGRLRII